MFAPFRFGFDLSELAAQLKTIHAEISQLRGIIMGTQAELQADLEALKAQADKARQEIVDKFAELEQAVANAGIVSDGVIAAMAGLKASIGAVDDLVPDAPPAEG